MAYTLWITGPAQTGKRNLATRVVNELADRKINVELLDAAVDHFNQLEASASTLNCARLNKLGHVCVMVSDDQPTGMVQRSEPCPCVEVFIFRPEGEGACPELSSPGVVIRSGRDGLKTGLNKIFHYLETHRLTPEKRTGHSSTEQGPSLTSMPSAKAVAKRQKIQTLDA